MPFRVVYSPEPTRPGNGPQPGTVLLLDYLCNDSPWSDHLTSLGIYNPRDICGNLWPKWKCVGSQHASGRAGDAGCRIVRPNGHPAAREAATWLVENHAALGVQEVIFAARRWDNRTRTWRAYSGRSPHYDHLHFAQHTAGASRLTLAQIEAVAPQEDDMTPEQDARLKRIEEHLRQLNPWPPEKLNSVGKKDPQGKPAARHLRWAAESLDKLRRIKA